MSHDTVLEMFRDTVAKAPGSPMLLYFDTTLTAVEVNRISDALAVALAEGGFGAGDRVALYLQNVPHYVIALLAAWKLGGVAVAINPMLTPPEVAKLLSDSAPTVLVTLAELHTDDLAQMLRGSSVTRVITTSTPPQKTTNAPLGTDDFDALVARHERQAPRAVVIGPDDVAVITYTSGTTGVPKGATNTHRNIATGGTAYRDWFGLGSDDVVLGVAPLFHVTGLSGHIACAIAARASLVLFYRFDLGAVADVIRARRPTFTVGAITVFIALANAPDIGSNDLASLTKIASGGAPIPSATVERFESRFGVYIHNVYGMTETTSPVLAVPMGTQAPVESRTGALSVGRPMGTARVRVLDESGADVPAGEVGELAVSGPQVVPGYWRNDSETKSAMRDGWLLTGDVGYADEDGWYYLVDRKKDMIVASGYKVWPREVEDVLYAHEAILEAGVVGVPDAYRGESVKAYVSLREGFTVEPGELVDFCRTRMAAYKYPREVEIVETIPKTVTGKILRRTLRSSGT